MCLQIDSIFYLPHISAEQRGNQMNKKCYWSICLLFFASFLVGCTYTSQGIFLDDNRSAIPEPNDHFGDSATKIVYADQNWDPADSLWFYNTSQGSNMIPYDIFIHLEQSGSTQLFRSDENIRKYRYLPQPSSWDNEDGLPIGFVRNEYQEKTYVGLTCAACHSNQINYQGVGIRIDGAPTLGDIQLLLEDLAVAMQTTASNEEKFQRLATKIVQSDDPKAIDIFRNEFQTLTMDFHGYNSRNSPLHNGELVHYGYARLDAFGRIFNRILGHLTPEKNNYNPANAPVSYPFLWDTPHHDFVQWNGVLSNTGAGPLGRNTGEVLGVFATFDLDRKKGHLGYQSSSLNRNQIRLERQVKRLISPLWQDLTDKGIFPEIDHTLAKKGKEVFEEYRCHLCHQAIDRKDPNRLVIAQFTSLDLIGTDEFMAKNAITDQGNSGYFEGKTINPLKPKEKFGKTTLAATALTKAVTGVILEPNHDNSFFQRWANKIYDLIVAIFDTPVKVAERHFDFEIVDDDPKFLLAYKGRPLNGIWATAPYLHNGSVPNLYELFLPSCSAVESTIGKTCRSRTFTVGSREFDPKKVGFVIKNKKEFPDLFVFDTSKPSNSNSGHEYAVGNTPVISLDKDGKPRRDAGGQLILEKLEPITDEKRWALVEYLKTL